MLAIIWLFSLVSVHYLTTFLYYLSRSAFLGSVCHRVGVPYWNILSGRVEDGESPVPWKDVFEFPGPSAPLLLEAGTQQGEERLLEDSAKPTDDTDFLKGTFININSDKQKATRNKKNSKKKGTGKKGRKQSHASEIESDPSPTKPSSTCTDAAGGEALVSLSSHVAVGIPLLEFNTSSSSLVTELLISPAVNSTSILLMRRNYLLAAMTTSGVLTALLHISQLLLVHLSMTIILVVTHGIAPPWVIMLAACRMREVSGHCLHQNA